ncbi:tRNA pseudouridine(31) synthase [Nakaseomyces bracarensis]|uniref:tRNA pseudouridine(31) synthase n=1 Tax=Nakaseomyces bracarensis TaxID=273131 RepID=A0ABR4NP14_9SACH
MCNVQVYYQNGLRKIRPYYHTRSSYAKGRWLHKSLLEVLVKEFRAHSREFYAQQILKGNYRLSRDGTYLDPQLCMEVPIQNKDIVESTVHKHEPPVKQWNNGDELDIPQKKIAGIDIIYEDDNLFVVDKPCGIPIHPTGLFYQNSLTELFQGHGKEVLPAYRLDKVTSGLLIMSKNQTTASTIQAKIRSHNMQKWYLAKVMGKFPKINEAYVPVNIENIILPTDEVIEISEDEESPITIEESAVYTIEPKRQFPTGLKPAKQAKTVFYPLIYCESKNESLVACRPITGRTHQIRIHLARLNHPIVNDSLYCQNVTKYPERLKFMLENPEWKHCGLSKESLQQKFNDFIQETIRYKKAANELNKLHPICNECGAITLDDPPETELELWLHAWRYSDKEGTLNFKTELPRWANL